MPCGDFSNPLDVYRLGTGHETVMNHPQTPATTSTPAEPEQAGAFGAGSQSSTQGAANVGGFSFTPGPVFGAEHKDYENVTLMRMRQMAERNKLNAELAAKETNGGV
mmetsp:Transcript_32600/g.62630  ORF Transcript_32600/g.62630 Transcript_32600/m.62630 type:complete len:107 (+) Transcript_32600:305-625(+)